MIFKKIIDEIIKSFKPYIYVTFIILLSCEFTPSEEYYVEIAEPKPPELEIELNLTDTAQVIFYWESAIKISINDENLTWYQVDFYLDNNKISNYKDGSIYYSNININDSLNHSFRIELIVGTGTNSIADSYGAEAFIYTSREWTLVARDTNINENGTIAFIDNGLLLNWKAYDGINLKNYRIKKHVTDTVYETNNTSFFDDEYLGEDGKYSIYVVDDKDNEFLWAECTTNNALELRIDAIDKKLALVWNAMAYEDKINEYVIYTRRNSDYYWEYLATVNSDVSHLILPNDGVLRYCRLGEMRSFKMCLEPKNEYNLTNDDLFNITIELRVGIPGPTFSKSYGSTSKGFLFENNDSIYFYSSDNDESEALFPLITNIVISPDAEYIVVPESTSLELYTVANFNFLKSVNIKEEISSYNDSCFMEISDNGLVAISIGNDVFIYDIINEELVTQQTYDRNYAIVISPNGQYILLYSENIVITNEIMGNSLVQLNLVTNPDGWYNSEDFLLIPDEPDKVYSIGSYQIIIRSITDLSIQRSVNISFYNFYNIDFINNKTLSFYNVDFYIHDFLSGNLLGKIPAINPSGKALLCDSTIFCDGYKYYLNN